MLNELILTVIDSIITILIFCTLIEKEKYSIGNKLKFILFVLIFSVISYWATLFIPSGIHTVAIYVFAALCSSFFFKTNMLSSIFIWIVTFVLLIIIEFSVLATAIFISGYSLEELLSDKFTYFVSTAVAKLAEAIFIVVAYKFKLSRYLKLKVFDKGSKLPMLIVIQAFLSGLIILSVNIVVSKPEEIQVYNIFLFLIYMFFIVLAVIDFKERERLSLLRSQYTLQEEHIKNIEAIISITRKEKHDFYNHLNTIYGLTTLNKPDMTLKIQQYINKITGKSYLSNKSLDTGNDYIDALLAVKNNYALDNNIEFKVNIKDSLDCSNIDDKDLVAVFSNIIDNSIEAVLSETKKDNNYMSVTTYISEGDFFISFKNNGPMIPDKNMKKIFQNGFSTKSEDAESHGFGLYIVKQKIDSWGGTIIVNSDDKETEFLVKLEIKDNKNEKDSYKNSANNLYL